MTGSSRPRERTEHYAGLAESLSYLRGNLRRAGSVAVDADCLGIHGNFAAVARNHYSSLRDAKRLPRRFLGIADQRVRKLARPQSSIRLIPPVGERFGSHGE